MEDFFGTAIFIIFLAISLFGRMNRAAKQRDRRAELEEEDADDAPRAERPTWPGPVAGPGVPGLPKPEWPQAPTARRQGAGPVRRAPSPSAQPRPEEAGARGAMPQEAGPEEAGKGWGQLERAGEEGARTDWFGTEGVRTEGSRTEGPTGTMDDVVARFAAESNRFMSTRFETELANPDRLEVEPSPSVATTRVLLRLPRARWAQAVALSEVLGKPVSMRRRK